MPGNNEETVDGNTSRPETTSSTSGRAGLAHVEPSDTIDCASERAADRILLDVSGEVIDYLGGAVSMTHYNIFVT